MKKTFPFSPLQRICSVLKRVQDHWVADHTRDTLISARGRLPGDPFSSKPEMVVDKNGIGHAFCIGQSSFQTVLRFKLTITASSETMAEKIAPWVEEIITGWRG